MPLVIPSALITEKNLLYSSGAFLELLRIEIDDDYVYIVNNNEDISWNGNVWSRWRFEPGDFSESQEGEVQSVPVKVSNIQGTLQGYIDQTTNKLIGNSVTYYLVHSDHLNDDAIITLNLSIIYIEADPLWVTFHLGAENFFLKRFPLNVFNRNVCRYSHEFKGARCQYSGSEATCDGQFSTCISYGNQLNFGNCPALPGGGFIATAE